MSDVLGARSLHGRVRTQWQAKLWVGALLTALFLGGYFTAQRVTLREPFAVPTTALDDWIGFNPAWVYAYQSLYALLPVAWLAGSREELRRYIQGFLIVSITGLLCFVLFPTTVPRPTVVGDPVPLYRLLIDYDRPLNCLPSLHVALAIYSTCFAATVFPNRWTRWSLVAWCLLISYATLAIKQHVLLDVLAGVAVGWMGHSVAWRRPPVPRQAMRFAANGEPA